LPPTCTACQTLLTLTGKLASDGTGSSLLPATALPGSRVIPQRLLRSAGTPFRSLARHITVMKVNPAIRRLVVAAALVAESD
jgi:hypothetical protein